MSNRKLAWRLFWSGMLVIVLIAEFIAIFNKEPDDTISENVWAFISLSWLTWLLTGAFLLWMSVHFLLPRVRSWWRRKPWRN